MLIDLLYPKSTLGATTYEPTLVAQLCMTRLTRLQGYLHAVVVFQFFVLWLQQTSVQSRDSIMRLELFFKLNCSVPSMQEQYLHCAVQYLFCTTCFCVLLKCDPAKRPDLELLQSVRGKPLFTGLTFVVMDYLDAVQRLHLHFNILCVQYWWVAAAVVNIVGKVCDGTLQYRGFS